MNELKKIRKQQRAEDKKVAEKMMAVSTKKPANKGLTKAERKAAEEYDAKSNNTTAAQQPEDETRIAQAVEFLLQQVSLPTQRCYDPPLLGTLVLWLFSGLTVQNCGREWRSHHARRRLPISSRSASSPLPN